MGPAEAGPTESTEHNLWDWLKLVPLKAPSTICGTGFSREVFDLHLILIFLHSQPSHRQSRLNHPTLSLGMQPRCSASFPPFFAQARHVKPSVGAGLLANAVCQPPYSYLIPCIRQQAGSYDDIITPSTGGHCRGPLLPCSVNPRNPRHP